MADGARQSRRGAEIVPRQGLPSPNDWPHAEPGNIRFQRDLSVSNERIGDILLAQGELDAALEQYRASLARMVPLRCRSRQHDLQRFTSVTLDLIGDALVAKGKLAEALDTYRDSLEIARALPRWTRQHYVAARARPATAVGDVFAEAI